MLLLKAVGLPDIFGTMGWFQSHYHYLCDFSHSRVCAVGRDEKATIPAQNAGLWQSTGAVYADWAVRWWYDIYKITACAIVFVLTIAYPSLPAVVGPWDSTRWSGYCRTLLSLWDRQPEWAEVLAANWTPS